MFLGPMNHLVHGLLVHLFDPYICFLLSSIGATSLFLSNLASTIRLRLLAWYLWPKPILFQVTGWLHNRIKRPVAFFSLIYLSTQFNRKSRTPRGNLVLSSRPFASPEHLVGISSTAAAHLQVVVVWSLVFCSKSLMEARLSFNCAFIPKMRLFSFSMGPWKQMKIFFSYTYCVTNCDPVAANPTVWIY